MTTLRRHSIGSIGLRQGFYLLGAFLFLAFSGCKSGAHTSDPHLRQIDEMLNSQLPQGTPQSRVIYFLNARSFPLENSNDAKVIVATVHHVDTETLQPATARVTFRFDASGKLVTYELAPAAESPRQP